jgi:hypothetical protein
MRREAESELRLADVSGLFLLFLRREFKQMETFTPMESTHLHGDWLSVLLLQMVKVYDIITEKHCLNF